MPEYSNMTPVQKKQMPLDTLMVAQVASLRQREAALQSRLRPGSRVESSIANELWSLQVSADRLNRMIDAMGMNTSYSSATGSMGHLAA
jgi:hypothetical protein